MTGDHNLLLATVSGGGWAHPAFSIVCKPNRLA